MANPQLESGFLKIANEIVEALAKNRIPGEQMQCLFVILRMTYGWNQKKAVIRVRDFVKQTGLKAPNVIRSIKGLLSKKIIIKSDNKSYPSYCLNRNLDKWKTLSKVITKNIKPYESRADKDVIKTDNKKTLSKLITPVIKTDNKTEIVPIIYKDISKDTDRSVFLLYDFYKTEINSLGKSSHRAKKYLTDLLKKYSFNDLKKSISNYKSICGNRKPEHKKDPANFFSPRDNYFFDYLPKNFEAPPEDVFDPWEGRTFSNVAQV